MMRYSILTALFLILSTGVSHFAHAQSDNSRRYYGGSTETGSGSIYLNPNANYGTGGPISIPQLLRGNKASSSSYNSSYYGGKNYRPYGVDNNSYSLSLSPDEVRESRARRDREAQRIERESQNQIEQASYSETLNQSEGYLNKFQNNNGTGVRRPTATQRRIYRKRDKGFEMPKKVFNSIY